MKAPRFIRTSIQNKLFSSFLIVLLLLAAEIAASFVIIGNLGKASQKILQMNYNSVIASIEMLDNLEAIQREYLLSRSDSEEFSASRLYEAESRFAQALGKAKNNITESGEGRILARLDSLYSSYLGTLHHASNEESSEHPQLKGLDTRRAQIRTLCFDLMRVNQSAMFSKSEAARRIALRGTLTLVLVTALVLVFGVLLSWGLSRRIVKPILTLKEATQRLRQGNYAVDLPGGGEDELGILTTEFAAMASTLREFNELNLRKTIAEQQKSEVILASIQEGIYFVGVDCLIRDANSAALSALGLKREDVVGHHFLEVVKQENLFTDLKTCLETKATLVYEAHDNVLVRRRDGKQAWWEYFFTPVLTGEGEILGAVFLLRDITNFKELDRLKSEFVMIVSHELKTPLTSINMSIDLLRESLGSAPKEGDLELIGIAKDEINRLRLLVNDLLDLSKIEAGKIEMKFAAAQPLEIMEAVVQYFKTQAAEQDALLEIVRPVPECGIWCDQEKLLLVFSNLVSNALKSIGPQGRIALSAEVSGDFVLFCVRDNGIGIPLIYQNRIFDRFMQIEEQNAARGTGLGLTICREIVRAHGGSIWVESSPGQGAAFYFTVPAEPSILNQNNGVTHG